MSIKLAIAYLWQIFSTNKGYVTGSFVISFIMQPILKLIELYTKNDEITTPIVGITLLTFITFLMMLFEFILSGLLYKKYKNNIASHFIGILVGKMFGLIIYYGLSVVLITILYYNMFALTVLFGPIILTILKEFTTIGEDFEKLYGRKAYLFSIIDKLFDLLEFKYFKSVEEKELPKIDDIVNKTLDNEQTIN